MLHELNDLLQERGEFHYLRVPVAESHEALTIINRMIHNLDDLEQETSNDPQINEFYEHCLFINPAHFMQGSTKGRGKLALFRNWVMHNKIEQRLADSFYAVIKAPEVNQAIDVVCEPFHLEG